MLDPSGHRKTRELGIEGVAQEQSMRLAGVTQPWVWAPAMGKRW